MSHYSIGEFAKKTGLSIPTLRYYEQEKLIYSHREENNHRYYNDSDVAWAQFIIRLKETGMSIKDMKKYADLRSRGDATIPQRLKLLSLSLMNFISNNMKLINILAFLKIKSKLI